ncbi:serine hydrolase domain-containing protein [Flavilitoribacter nigricans]|uniref:Beta-lactamase-related domain-containing protein n=1 Tax=Flavilitoribacter nigricans (strain ATCC 23147 / DSM 23189 / NBRC 102662 / NCIMB 1420 / SS-2) TaxID=1122177 RepID=A0A2D0N672_FLAN2|nr:serine hydrolase domain-containing protein [Flavilitoribacter nigricans]PHN04011.1 hypothetical protein CRP01_24390 [Flavilitoribacter nigricans DSM 23189 = NBRC 102662]
MKKSILLLTLLSLLYLSCDLTPAGTYHYRAPDPGADGLPTGSLSEVAIDTSPIIRAVNRIYSGRYQGMHSMLIFKDNKLVLEEYFPGHKWQWEAPAHHGEWIQWDADQLHNIHSAAKSVTSACIGIAIDRGIIQSEDQSIWQYLPDHQHLKKDGKEGITIRHLLTMTSGLYWPEWSAPYSSGENPAVGIYFSEKDPITFILEMPLVAAPGSQFNYSTGNVILLGEIIRNASGMPMEAFSGKYLFQPLGIEQFEWSLKLKNEVDGNTLEITARDMIKIGATFLNGGLWQGRRIISEDWVKKSATTFPGIYPINVPGEPSGKMGYSYTWWTKDYKHSGQTVHLYAASGFGGQHIMVLPELNTVVAFTGGNYLTRRPPFKLLEKYILPAIRAVPT